MGNRKVVGTTVVSQAQRCHRKRARDPCPGQWLLENRTKWTRMISPEKEKTLRIGLTEIRLVKIII